MNGSFRRLGAALAVLHPVAAFAAPEEVLDTLFRLGVYAALIVVATVFLGVHFFRSRDRRRTPLRRLLAAGNAVHAVGPEATVIDCVRKMAAEKIGALVVIDGEALVGIFTERDALNKVLAAGLDPVGTKVSAVMTADPHCVPPAMTVGEAMEAVTQRRFRHLPIVEGGRVLAVVSSRDLTHWLVGDQGEEVQRLVDLAAGA